MVTSQSWGRFLLHHDLKAVHRITTPAPLVLDAWQLCTNDSTTTRLQRAPRGGGMVSPGVHSALCECAPFSTRKRPMFDREFLYVGVRTCERVPLGNLEHAELM